MKSLKLRSILLAVATALTLGLSHAVAQAKCADLEFGGNAYGDYACRLIAGCGGWCYYSCTCSGLFAGYTCDDVLAAAGFETVDSIPCAG